MSTKKEIQPINRAQFGAAEHRFSTWDAEVSEDLTKEDLVNDRLWVNLAPNLKVGDEIRVRAVDGSFVGRLYVYFKLGNQVLTTLLWLSRPNLKEAPEVNTDQIGDYTVKQRGQEGWCLVQVSTGHVIQNRLGNKSDALKALEQHIRALAA